MKVLVLGGTGAMGAYLVNLLAEKNWYVDVTTRKNKKSNNHKIKFLQGDAHNYDFLKSIAVGYDIIVDFMAYKTPEFRKRFKFFLDVTGQYIFLSTSRVYADSAEPIKETSKRLLDVSMDETFLKTDEYSLTKARQENLLFESSSKNWTIIRPYITYSNERLQLGVYEKEMWLYRVLQGRPIVFSRDIAAKTTTLTWGMDVAGAIAELCGNDRALGQTYQITGSDCISWGEVLKLYQEIIAREMGRTPDIYLAETAIETGTVQGYAIQYDRLYDRRFDSSKIAAALDGNFHPLPIRMGLEKCLTEFLRERRPFRDINWKCEALMDRISNCRTPMKNIPSTTGKIKYTLFRDFHLLGQALTGIKRRIRLQ